MDINKLEIDSIENKLDSILRPVNPKEIYSTTLKERLLNESGITLEKQNYLFIILLLCSFFFIGVVLIYLINIFFNRKSE